VDEKAHILHVVVADDQLSLAIGKRGRNARLASKLVGWKVDIKSVSAVTKEAERKQELRRRQLSALQSLPGVGEKMAERLADAGFLSLEKIAYAPLDVLKAVKGIGEKTAEKLASAAREVLASGGEVRKGEEKSMKPGGDLGAEGSGL
jgi:N utilization substance protein A